MSFGPELHYGEWEDTPWWMFWKPRVRRLRTLTGVGGIWQEWEYYHS